MKPIKYELNIYEPGSYRVLTGSYESSSPFPSIRKGDFLHPFPRPDGENGWQELGPSSYLRATEVHHKFYDPVDKDYISHILVVYTEVYENE